MEKYLPKYKLDTALIVALIMIGISVTSTVFGFLFFPVVTQICATALLLGVVKVGYVSVAILLIGLLLEAYNLYEHHRRHVVALMCVSIAACALAVWLMHGLAIRYSC